MRWAKRPRGSRGFRAHPQNTAHCELSDLASGPEGVPACTISRFGPTRFPDLGPTFPGFPAKSSERIFMLLLLRRNFSGFDSAVAQYLRRFSTAASLFSSLLTTYK